MPKPGQVERQFNVKVRGEREIGIIEATYNYCRENQINVSDFVVDALSKALDTKLLPQDDVRSIKQDVEELRAKLENFERQLNNLNDCVSDDVPKLNNDMWIVKQMLFDCSEPLVRRVEQLERAQLEISEVKITAGEVDATAPDSLKMQCPHCGAVGILHKNFKPSGSSKGRRRFDCLSCHKKFLQPNT